MNGGVYGYMLVIANDDNDEERIVTTTNSMETTATREQETHLCALGSFLWHLEPTNKNQQLEPIRAVEFNQKRVSQHWDKARMAQKRVDETKREIERVRKAKADI